MKTLSRKNSIFIVLNYCLGYLFIYPFLLSTLGNLLFIFLKIDIFDFLLLIFYVLFFIAMIFAGRVLLLDAWNQLKRNGLIILKCVFINLVYSLFVSYILNILISLLTTQASSNNQVFIEDGLQQNPVFIIIIALVFAPIVEELVFRGVIYNKIKIRSGFLPGAIISSVLFGLLHVLDSLLILNFSDIPFAISYMALGFFIAKSYKDTDSLAGSILFHFINNLMGVLVIYVLR